MKSSNDQVFLLQRLEIFVETCKQEFENLRYVKDEQMLKVRVQ